MQFARYLFMVVPYLFRNCTISAIDAPVLTMDNFDEYAHSVDPLGYSRRPGSYWPIQWKLVKGEYPAYIPVNTGSYDALPKAIAQSNDVYMAMGADGIQNSAARFTGTNQGCLKISDLGSNDSCLFDPATCKLEPDGLTLALWVRLAPTYSIDEKHIIDTGGSENGEKGILIKYQDSTGPKQFEQQLTIVVSTGEKHWKIVLTGMLQYSKWQNLAIRWANSDELGLQIFVNRNPVAWKKVGVESTNANNQNRNIGTVTVGCALDGSKVMLGAVDELVIWYWRLVSPEGKAEKLPLPNEDQGQLVWLDGPIDSTVNTIININVEPPGLLTDMPTGYIVTAFDDMLDNNDSIVAIDGNCARMTCADTVSEVTVLQDTTDRYTGPNLVNAIVRTVNRAGDSGLSDSELRRLENNSWKTYLQLKIDALVNDTSKDQLLRYAEIGRVLGKLSDEHVYGDRWITNALDGKRAITDFMEITDGVLMNVARSVSPNAVVIKEFNETIILVGNVYRVKMDLLKPFVQFPNPQSDQVPKLAFKRDNHLTEYWKDIGDSFDTNVRLFHGWRDKYTKLSVVTALHRQLHKHIPAVVDIRVNGSGVFDARFYVASRILSFSVEARGDDHVVKPIDMRYLTYYPVTFTVEHLKPQFDAAYKKGAVLCVHWRYNDEPTRLGAWDTSMCSVLDTNDTHTRCACAHMSDYAVLIEDVDPVHYIPDEAYIIVTLIFLVSILLLGVFVLLVFMRSALHNELYIIQASMATSLLMALICFLASSAVTSRESISLIVILNLSWNIFVPLLIVKIGCIVISITMHYFYLVAYCWLAIFGRYIHLFAAQMNLRENFPKYCIAAWTVPAIFVLTFAGTDVAYYGKGRRCFASMVDGFAEICVTCVLVVLGISALFVLFGFYNLLTYKLKGTKLMHFKKLVIGFWSVWTLACCTWLMCIGVYVRPQVSQAYDFCFELFNSLQGIFVFVSFGLPFVQFRSELLCRKGEPSLNFDDMDSLYTDTDDLP